MRIALVSYEYAGHANGGGIGTYVRGAAAMLAGRGHDVEVFTSGEGSASELASRRLLVHSVCTTRTDFPQAIVPVFAQRNAVEGFDVIEGPEFGADAAAIASAFPEIALVVKLHAPRFTIDASNAHYVNWRRRGRYFLGALRRGRLPDNPWQYRIEIDNERTHALDADEIVANSHATAELVGNIWGLPRHRLAVVPLIFEPAPRLLAIDPESRTNTVLFLGRIEVRKGVLELAKAVSTVARQMTDVRFRFVGRSLPHPADGVPLSEHIKRAVGQHAPVEIVDGIPYEMVPLELARADICVFPSDWEASGFVCLEAMAAARGVIGSSAGGMAEIIEHGRSGLLVPPRNPRAIADAILTLLRDPERRIAMGRAAREHVLSAYSPDVIAPLQEASYVRAMERARAQSTAA